MDWSFLKPNPLLTKLGQGELPTVQTKSEVNLNAETVVLITLAIIIIILAFSLSKKYVK